MDIESLLKPLDFGDQGSGSDLRADTSSGSLFQELFDARSQARTEERVQDGKSKDSNDSQDFTEVASWRKVLKLGCTALETRSKDIRIAVWVTEALVRKEGISGLTDGARLLNGLCDSFWDSVFPLPDEDGLEVRSAPIMGLSGGNTEGTLMQPLRRVALFRRADRSGVNIYLWDQAEQGTTGSPELSSLEAEARSDRAYLVAKGDELREAIVAWSQLDETLDKRFGSSAPSLRRLRTLLERMLEVVERLGGGTPTSKPDLPADAQSLGVSTPSPSDLQHRSASLGDLNRELALRELLRIAEFFRQTEPHSPLSYTLEEAVRRARMSLTELLSEVLSEERDAHKTLLMRLGMRREEEPPAS